MSEYTRFNQTRIQDRQVEKLLGLCEGIAADDVVSQEEVKYLKQWLERNLEVINNPLMKPLYDRIEDMLEDGTLDAEEQVELLETLKKVSGGDCELGEISKATTLPVDVPPPSIQFSNKLFLFTGMCVYGNRKTCEKAVESLGGKIINNVTRSLDYLIIGKYVTDSWVHENFGRKIEKAVEYRDRGLSLVIITEAHWLQEGKIA